MIAFLDESGANLTPLVGKTWAPRGQTPVLKHTMGRWTKVNMVSAVTHTNWLYFHLKVGGAIRQPDLTKFLRSMMRQTRKKILLFWDNGGCHLGPILRRFLERHRDKIRIKNLPPYAFDYNPDEGDWTRLKRTKLQNHAPPDTEALVRSLRSGLRRMQRRPALIKACWTKTRLPGNDVDALLN